MLSYANYRIGAASYDVCQLQRVAAPQCVTPHIETQKSQFLPAEAGKRGIMRFLRVCCLLVPSACHLRLSSALAALTDQKHSPKFSRCGPTSTARLSTPAGRLIVTQAFIRSGQKGYV